VAPVPLAAAQRGEHVEGEGVQLALPQWGGEALQQGELADVLAPRGPGAVLLQHVAEEELQETRVLLVVQLKLPGADRG
jgi:hypothetical protein